MNIIKKGRLSEEEVWKGTCHRCKSVITAKRGELAIQHDPKVGEDNDFGKAACPLPGCGATVNFYPTRGQ